jgi:menaquinone-dependent protoporphyrinogen oxidase
VLVAYASKCGATAAAAEYIGQRLCERGCQVDTRRARNVTDIGAYQALILGSAVYMGGLLGEASSFASKFQADLADIPTALFNLGLTMKDNTAENLDEALAYFDPLRAYLEPQVVAAFAGRIDLDTLPPLYRAFAQADTDGILAEGDYRDWDALRDWVDALPADFLPA